MAWMKGSEGRGRGHPRVPVGVTHSDCQSPFSDKVASAVTRLRTSGPRFVDGFTPRGLGIRNSCHLLNFGALRLVRLPSTSALKCGGWRLLMVVRMRGGLWL